MNSNTISRPTAADRTRQTTLVAGMAIGSIVMWVVIPAAWILLAAQASHAGQPTLAPLLMFFVGAPLTMLPTAKLLGMMDRRHQQLGGHVDDRRRPAPWQRSMRDSTENGPQSVLAIVMVGSVAVAFAALAVWFFLFAGSSLPNP